MALLDSQPFVQTNRQARVDFASNLSLLFAEKENFWMPTCKPPWYLNMNMCKPMILGMGSANERRR